MTSAAQKREIASEQLKAKRVAYIGAMSYELHTENKAHGIIVWTRKNASGSVCVAAFSGRRAKPDFFYNYMDMQRAESAIASWLKKLQDTRDYKEKRKAKEAALIEAGHGLEVGDVLSACWGWEQTNYSYFQITKLVGKRSVEIREIGRQVEDCGNMQGVCVPVKNCFKGDAEIFRVTSSGSVKINSCGGYASKKEPIKIGNLEVFKADHFTSYA